MQWRYIQTESNAIRDDVRVENVIGVYPIGKSYLCLSRSVQTNCGNVTASRLMSKQ